MEDIFSKPVVTIDLEEYLMLKKNNDDLRKKRGSDEVDTLALISSVAMEALKNEKPHLYHIISQYIQDNKGFYITHQYNMDGLTNNDPQPYNVRTVLKKVK